MGDGRGRHRAAARLAAGVLALLVIAGCTVDGSAVMAPYRSPPLDQLSAAAISTDVAGVLALAPSGGVVAVRDAVHGVCLKPVGVGSAGVGPVGRPTRSVSAPTCSSTPNCRSPQLSRRTDNWLRSARMCPPGGTAPCGWRTPEPAGRGRCRRSVGRRSCRAPGALCLRRAPSPVSTYIAMVWNSSSGHLLLIANSINPSGPTTRVVDVDPASLIPRVVALATGPYEFQSGCLATGGSKVIFTVYQGDQGAPNLVEVDLATGTRNEFGPLGPNGTQVVPLAVSPDGRQAVLGSSGSAGCPTAAPAEPGVRRADRHARAERQFHPGRLLAERHSDRPAVTVCRDGHRGDRTSLGGARPGIVDRALRHRPRQHAHLVQARRAVDLRPGCRRAPEVRSAGIFRPAEPGHRRAFHVRQLTRGDLARPQRAGSQG